MEIWTSLLQTADIRPNFIYYNNGKEGFKLANPLRNSEEQNFVYVGQKNGEFIEIGLRKDLKDETYNIEIGDLKTDGFPDIVESNSGTWNLY